MSYHGNSDSVSDPLASSGEARTSASSHYGQCNNGVSVALLLVTALGIGIMLYTLFTKVTMGRKRKRSNENQELFPFFTPIKGLVVDGTCIQKDTRKFNCSFMVAENIFNRQDIRQSVFK